MRNLTFAAVISIFSLFSTFAIAAGPSLKLDKVDIDLYDKASLQRGAHTFMNYCLSCHGASLMRYNRMAKDLGLTNDQVADNLMFTTDKIGETMQIAMQPEDAKRWFGVVPPDLSVIARARGTDWLYTYLRTFYLDDSRPMGTNNLAFKDVGMPHVLWEQQGYQTLDADDHLDATQENVLTPRQYDIMSRDLVNFLAYISEPSKLQRLALGKWVLLYLAIFFVIALALKKAYWKDVQ